jgi:hemolysin III
VHRRQTLVRLTNRDAGASVVKTAIERAQSLGEEIANSVSHGVGFLAAVAAFPFLILGALQHGATAVVGAAVFGATVSLLYLTSTIYHSLRDNRAKRLFRVFDHGAIYLLIAGTYTPFTLGALHGPWGWTLFGLIWAFALFGVVLKSMGGIKYHRLSTALYLGMGWLVIIAARPLWLHVPAWGLIWLAAGGVAYTAGVVFYVASARVRYAHFIWHLFVLTGNYAA